MDPGCRGGKARCSCCGVPLSSGIVARVMESRFVGEASAGGISMICLSSSCMDGSLFGSLVASDVRLESGGDK